MSEEEIKKDELFAPGPAPLAKKKELSLPVAIVVAGALIALSIMITMAPAGAEGDDKLDLIPDLSAEDFVRGNADAPITIIEYADFKCPACAAYQPILRKLVDESNGEIKWTYRDFPIFSQEAAAASRCVGKIGGSDAFWKYTDMLFVEQSSITSDFLREKALQYGVTDEGYGACMNDPVLEKSIDREYNRLKYLLGLNSTPTTVIIDKKGQKYMFTGALYEETLLDIIDTLDK